MTEVRKSSATFVLGRDVGLFGRWLRLIGGVLLLGGILWDEVADPPPLGFYGATALYFVVVTGIYLVGYYLLSEGVFARANAWINTLILVGPPVMVFVLDLGPDAFQVGLWLYVGVSLIANFVMSYGGCEVVALPSLILRRKYTVYCPMNAVDVVEKAVVERKARTNRKETG
jgi:hypothetical protein